MTFQVTNTDSVIGKFTWGKKASKQEAKYFQIKVKKKEKVDENSSKEKCQRSARLSE